MDLHVVQDFRSLRRWSFGGVDRYQFLGNLLGTVAWFIKLTMEIEYWCMKPCNYIIYCIYIHIHKISYKVVSPECEILVGSDW